MEANQYNLEARLRNKKALARVLNGSNPVDVSLCVLRKIRPGWGVQVGFPGSAEVPPEIGSPIQAPSFPFPATVKDLKEISTQNKKALAVAFNEDFGLQMHDFEADMLCKLETFH